jgi:Zn-dependent peptidase ImmA (M78 family)
VKRGFKSAAEQIAQEVRTELNLGPSERLDVLSLANHLAIPVFTIGEIARLASANTFSHYFAVVDPDCFSAVTVFCGHKRFIIHNENHHPHRQASNLAHEISHTLLEHRPAPLAGRDGRRYWDSEVEEEATWLGAALLVPRSGALEMVKARRTISQIADHYGVSESLCVWRIRQSGVDVQAERWRRFRRN